MRMRRKKVKKISGGLQKFENEINHNSEMGFSLSRRDVSELKNKYLSYKDWNKATLILKKYGYGKLAEKVD